MILREGTLTARAFMALLIIISVHSVQAGPKVDPTTGRLRLLVVGEQNGQNQYVMSILRSDPRIRLFGVIRAGASAPPLEARRYVRTIFPRTESRFVGSIDAIKYLDAPPWIFTDRQQLWIRDSIEESGLGFLAVEMGYHSCNIIEACNCPWDWMKSPIYEAWPIDVVLEKTVKPSVYAEIVEETPVVDLPEFERQPYGGPAGNLGLVKSRPGSTVHARWKLGKEDAIVSTEYGEGRTMALPTGWDCVSSQMVRNWKYFVDFVLNSVYFTSQIPVPDDPELAHALRSAFTQYGEQKALMLSLIDFIDKFGANTGPLHTEIDELDSVASDAGDFYLSGEYEKSWESIGAAIDGLSGLSEKSAELRRRSLLWVYITEWIAVSAASMLSGGILWTLMVKRHYYTEVESTRLGKGQR